MLRIRSICVYGFAYLFTAKSEVSYINFTKQICDLTDPWKLFIASLPLPHTHTHTHTHSLSLSLFLCDSSAKFFRGPIEDGTDRLS